jgi:hypothetical protein
MSIIGRPDKMFKDLKNSKGNRDLSATSLDVLVAGESHNGSNLAFSLRILECLA